MTRSEVLAVLALLATNYEHTLSRDARTGRSPLVELWCEALAPYDAAAVRAAALLHMARSPFWPKLSDLLQPLAAAGLADEDQAWAQVMAEVRRVGIYGRPQFADPLVAATVGRIGWWDLCTADDLAVVRGQFRAFYAAARRRAEVDQGGGLLVQALQTRGLALPVWGSPSDPDHPAGGPPAQAGGGAE